MGTLRKWKRRYEVRLTRGYQQVTAAIRIRCFSERTAGCAPDAICSGAKAGVRERRLFLALNAAQNVSPGCRFVAIKQKITMIFGAAA
jgi:hypothetical protein